MGGLARLGKLAHRSPTGKRLLDPTFQRHPEDRADTQVRRYLNGKVAYAH
jgi:hypothetical protein